MPQPAPYSIMCKIYVSFWDTHTHTIILLYCIHSNNNFHRNVLSNRFSSSKNPLTRCVRCMRVSVWVCVCNCDFRTYPIAYFEISITIELVLINVKAVKKSSRGYFTMKHSKSTAAATTKHPFHQCQKLVCRKQKRISTHSKHRIFGMWKSHIWVDLCEQFVCSTPLCVGFYLNELKYYGAQYLFAQNLKISIFVIAWISWIAAGKICALTLQSSVDSDKENNSNTDDYKHRNMDLESTFSINARQIRCNKAYKAYYDIRNKCDLQNSHVLLSHKCTRRVSIIQRESFAY